MVIVHLSFCNLVEDEEKRKEKREANRMKCVLLSNLLFRELFKDQLNRIINEKEIEDLNQRFFISIDTCQRVLNKKDDMD